MEKKKVNKILKSVAGVGVALGGASAFSDGDVVFAAEQEQQTVTEEQEQVVETEQKESEAHEEHLDSTADTNETQTQESKGSEPAQSVSEDNGNVADTTKDDNSTNDVTPDNNDGADTTQNDNGNTADTETGDNGNENQSVGGETTNTDDNSTNGTENAEEPETTGNNESDVLDSVRSESLSASDSTVKSTASESTAASEHEADEARKDSVTESASQSASESHEGSFWEFTQEELENIVTIDNQKKDGPIFVSINACGKGGLQIIGLHDRYSRRGHGCFLPGGERVVTSDREEIFYYFDPGDRKPPLNVYFSGYKTREGFEGYNMMRRMGCPFLLISESDWKAEASIWVHLSMRNSL